MGKAITLNASGAYALKARYCALWSQLQNIAQSVGSNADDSIVAVAQKDRLLVQTRDNRCLDMLAAPARASNNACLVDLHVSLIQEIRIVAGAPILTKSNVKVTYIESGKSECRVIETWHFDYSPDTRGHPIFHAQLTDDHLLQGSVQRKYLTPHRTPGLRDAPRVPCPPMDFPAVAAMIIFDHFSHRLEHLDAPDWTSIVETLPTLPWSHFKSQKWQKAPTARAWYPLAPA